MIHTVALQDILIQIRGGFSPKFEKKIKNRIKKRAKAEPRHGGNKNVP